MLRIFFERDIRPNKQSWLIGGILVSAVVALIIGKIWWESTRTYPAIVYHNKAVFYQGGWFFNGRTYDLNRLNGQWYFNGEELAVPMEGPWGRACVLRFEDRGRVYRVNKSDATRTELRIVNGEWSERCDDGWVSIYSDDDY